MEKLLSVKVISEKMGGNGFHETISYADFY